MNKKMIKLKLELMKEIVVNEYKDDFGRTIYETNTGNAKYDGNLKKSSISMSKKKMLKK